VSLHWVIAVGWRDQNYRILPSRGIQRQYSLLRKLKRIYNRYSIRARAIFIERVQYNYILPPDKKEALDS
jgi:hypothetical protein